MAEFLIIMIFIIALFLGIIVSFFFRALRFWIKVSRLNDLQKELFEDEELEKECKEKQILLKINGCRWAFDNFPAAIDFLEEFGEELYDECQKLANLAGEHEFKDGEEIIINAINQANMWKWKNGYIKNDEKQ